MTAASSDANRRDGQLPCIVGRSSSHYTRVVRMFAAECAIDCTFRAVPDLLSNDPLSYGGNPALRLPSLLTVQGPVFGSLGICRALAAEAGKPQRVVWPEDMRPGSSGNAMELTLQAMAAEVTWIMLRATTTGPSCYASKLEAALAGMLDWLEGNLAAVLATLPARDISYFELCLFCLLDHLEFRNVPTLARNDCLRSFRDQYATRPAAAATQFRFDA